MTLHLPRDRAGEEKLKTQTETWNSKNQEPKISHCNQQECQKETISLSLSLYHIMPDGNQELRNKGSLLLFKHVPQ